MIMGFTSRVQLLSSAFHLLKVQLSSSANGNDGNVPEQSNEHLTASTPKAAESGRTCIYKKGLESIKKQKAFGHRNLASLPKIFTLPIMDFYGHCFLVN